MKNIYSLLALICSTLIFAQTTIYSENFGTATGTVLIPVYTGYQATAPVNYAGTADIRTSTPSTGYVGASGNGCVFLGAVAAGSANPAKTLIVSGISTEGFENINLTLGHQKGTNVSSNELTIEVSADGATYTPLAYTRSSGTGTSVWQLIAPTGIIPTTATLTIRITNPLDSNVGFRIDDLKLTGTAIPLSATASTKGTFTIYPTVVTNGVIYITSDKNDVKNVKIYDSSSKLVINTQTKKEVDVSKLQKGLYFLNIEEQGKIVSKKFIIQ